MHNQQSWVGFIRTCVRADVHQCFVSWNSWTDCAEIWCVVGDQLARRFMQVRGGVHLHVRTCIRFSVSTNCAENWRVVRDPLAMRVTRVVCVPFRILETAGCIGYYAKIWHVSKGAY